MLRQKKSVSRYRDESVVSKWDQLKQYEEESSGAEQASPSRDLRELREYERNNGLFVVRTFQQIRESSSKTYSNIKNQVTELYRWVGFLGTFLIKTKNFLQKVKSGKLNFRYKFPVRVQRKNNNKIGNKRILTIKLAASLELHYFLFFRKTRSKAPAAPATGCPVPGSGFSQSPHGFQDNSSAGALQSLGMIGAKIRNSKSLQNLEVATLDNFRQIVDTTASAAENLKHKYGSRVELQNRAKYDKFKDDGDSEDERDM